MPSRSSSLRNSSGFSLFSSATRRIVRSTVVSSTRMPLSFAYCSSARSMIEALQHLLVEHVVGRRRDVRRLQLREHDPALLVQVPLRDRLVVDDDEHAVERARASSARGAGVAGARRCGAAGRRRDCASAAAAEQAAQRERAENGGGQMPSNAPMTFTAKTREADRDAGRDRAMTDRSWAGSPARCAAGVRAGWCRRARVRSVPAARTPTSSPAGSSSSAAGRRCAAPSSRHCTRCPRPPPASCGR